MRTTFVLVLSLALNPLIAADPQSKYALFVGVSKYNHADMNKPQLEFPEVDAKELAEIFRKSGYTVDLLLGKDATQAAIKAELEQFKKKGDSDGVVVIGLFGHGIEFESSKLACYCPYDTTMRNVVDSQGRKIFTGDGKLRIEPDPESLVTMEDLLDGLRLSPAGNRILLADCCRTDPNKARGRAFGSNLKLTDLPRNTAALFACSEDEQAFEHRNWGHGAFTKCLIDEITSQAKNRRITANRLADDLQPKVQELVASVSEGRNKQTVSPFVNGVVDFQLVITERPTIPSIVKAPFDEEQARSAQEAWAKSRGITFIAKNSIGAEMVVIPPGEFQMGNDESIESLLGAFPYADKNWVEDAKAQHKVRITQPFLLSKCEVTIRQFQQFVQDTNYVTDAEKDPKGGWGYLNGGLMQDRRFHWRNCGFNPVPSEDHPVVNVSWNDAVAFCNWLSVRDGRQSYYDGDGASVKSKRGHGYRLPSEAEWEYACRAGTTGRFYSGPEPEGLVQIGNVWDASLKTKFPTARNVLQGNDGYAFTAPVGMFKPNNFGLCDMVGNVWEWCGDWHSASYEQKPEEDPTGPAFGVKKVNRGGSWYSRPIYCRSAYRYDSSPQYCSNSLGFRLALTLDETVK